MIKQGIILLAAVVACLALGDGRGYHTKKNTFQAPSQYASVASFHASKPAQGQAEPQGAPSPYAFGYEADGSARQESGDASGKVSGSYKVTNEDGSVRLVKYVADEKGFRADIDTNEPGTKSDNPADVTLKSAAVEKKYEAPTKYAAAQTYTTKYEQKPIQFNLGSSGGAYSYNYESKLEDGGSNAHSESSDGSGRVTGYYSMSAADGRRRKVDYSADGAGFTAAVNTNEFGTKSDSPANVQFMSSAPQQQGPATSSFRQTSAFRQQQQVTQYSAPSYQQAPIQQTSQFSDTKPSPYAFSYDAQLEDGSSSRSESADASGKVVGSYSLATADGRKRLIKYTADHDGFRASVDTNEFGTKSDSPANVEFYSSAPQEAPADPQTYSAPAQRAPMSYAVQQTKISSGSGIKSTFQAPAMSYQGQSSVQYGATANDKPSPYSFEYAADLDDGSVSRSESGDESGKVVGSYSLSVADGRQRKVDYFADKAGFRATVNTNEFGTKADSPADVQFYSSASLDEPAPYSSPNAYKPSSSSAAMYSAPAIAQQPIQSPIQFSMGTGNGAYSYNYQASLEDGGNSAQSESSDGSGKVTGYYSMSIPDGRRRKVDYTADSTGFQASVDTNEFGTKSDSPAHVSFMSSAVQPAPEAPRAPTAFKAPAASLYSAPKASGSADMYRSSYISQQKVEPVQSFQPSPYAFNYEAEASGGSSARKEASDASGTVTGTYEVRNADGSVRVVDYIADKDGFRANVKTNELGTKSDNPADVTVKSDAPSGPVQVRQSSIQEARFPARTYTQKSSMISQKPVDAWSR
uniref:Putative cuticular protein n=1 Tax=Cupiennius salei TaxID=6928 RepID=A0A061QLE1_CUPSA